MPEENSTLLCFSVHYCTVTYRLLRLSYCIYVWFASIQCSPVSKWKMRRLEKVMILCNSLKTIPCVLHQLLSDFFPFRFLHQLSDFYPFFTAAGVTSPCFMGLNLYDPMSVLKQQEYCEKSLQLIAVILMKRLTFGLVSSKTARRKHNISFYINNNKFRFMHWCCL